MSRSASRANVFTVLEKVGKGSFGDVYKALKNDTKEVVAIKMLNLEESEEDIADIQQEIQILSRSVCPNVTKYYCSCLNGHQLWIVMEYCGGGSCLDLLNEHTLKEVHIAVILREVLKGLIYLHGEGIVHRDIKAANILLTLNGNVKLGDFGVAGHLNSCKTDKDAFVGSPFWMAPE
ncbi:serine/threonine-protein kinase 24-like, partial [Zophobas morio]|uniref:serine/threonine-protein kinase 24-like n=1 Tax=Zophobas morio TaxID=2755281 RepID=UPI0030837E3F